MTVVGWLGGLLFGISGVLSGAGCRHLPSQAFLDATGDFAEGSGQAAHTFIGEFDTAALLCRKRARMDFTQHRMESLPGDESAWGKKPLWTDWAAAHKISDADADTWQTHCDRIAQADDLQRRALRMILAYGNALKALSGAGHYDGSDLGDSVKQAGEIAASVAQNGTTATIRSAAEGIADPLNKIADFIIRARTQEELKAVIRDANPSVQKLFNALLQYTKAVDGEADDLERMEKDLLLTWEKKIARENLGGDPDRAANFHTFAANFDEELIQLRYNQEMQREVLEKLAKAHAQLDEASAGKTDNAVKLAVLKVLRLVHEVVESIGQIK